MATGSSALAPAPTNAWTTYNFEVEDTHTYIAEGVCVHNRCLEHVVTGSTLDALTEVGIINPETDTIIQTESGQYLLLTEDGRVVTEGSLEGHTLTKVIELFSDYTKHIGHSIESVISDTPQYLADALPGLFAALVEGQDFEAAIEAYGISLDCGDEAFMNGLHGPSLMQSA